MLQASALSAHAWLPLSLAHNMPFRPWHKLFPLLCLTLPWLTPTHWAGGQRKLRGLLWRPENLSLQAGLAVFQLCSLGQ